VRLVFSEGTAIYKIDWKSLVAVLESPVINTLRLESIES
jgi:hypothetical protein